MKTKPVPKGMHRMPNGDLMKNDAMKGMPPPKGGKKPMPKARKKGY